MTKRVYLTAWHCHRQPLKSTLHTRAVECLALLPDGLRFVSGSEDKTACIVEHGLAVAPTRAYVAAQKEALKARLRDERRRHADELERLNTKMVAVEAMERLM